MARMEQNEERWDTLRPASVDPWSVCGEVIGVKSESNQCFRISTIFRTCYSFNLENAFRRRQKVRWSRCTERWFVNICDICAFHWIKICPRYSHIFTVTSCTRDVSSQKGIGYIAFCQWLERLHITKQLSRHAADMQLITENERALNIQPASICILH